MNRDEMTQVIWSTMQGSLNFHAYRWQAQVIADSLIAAAGDEDAVFRVRKDAPETSKAIVEKIRSGSLQDTVMHLFVNDPRTTYPKGGWTDDELERWMGRSHQSVSACRNILVRKGYLTDSGARRKTRFGNLAIVWAWTGKEVTS